MYLTEIFWKKEVKERLYVTLCGILAYFVILCQFLDLVHEHFHVDVSVFMICGYDKLNQFGYRLLEEILRRVLGIRALDGTVTDHSLGYRL